MYLKLIVNGCTKLEKDILISCQLIKLVLIKMLIPSAYKFQRTKTEAFPIDFDLHMVYLIIKF